MSSMVAVGAVIAAFLFFVGTPMQHPDVDVPEGVFKKYVYIDSRPTTTRVYLDGKEIGKTPIYVPMWYGWKREVHIMAKPMYKNQYRQDMFLTLPPVPRKVMILMNIPPRERYAFMGEEDGVTEDAEVGEQIPAYMVIAPTVYFDFDKTEIKAGYKPRLKALIKWLKKYPAIEMEIHGYADERGEVGYNDSLSLRRARSVMKYLEGEGLDIKRVMIYGHGEITSVTKQRHVMKYTVNRKVEFKMRNIPEISEEMLVTVNVKPVIMPRDVGNIEGEEREERKMKKVVEKKKKKRKPGKSYIIGRDKWDKKVEMEY